MLGCFARLTLMCLRKRGCVTWNILYEPALLQEYSTQSMHIPTGKRLTRTITCIYETIIHGLLTLYLLAPGRS